MPDNKKKLLIVDDQDFYLNSLALPLKKKFEVEKAKNYDDAIKILQVNEINLALVDIRLDENDDTNTDGLKILEWISMNQPHVSVFIMSAYREFDYAEQSLNLGAKHFFKKPIDIISLRAILEEKS